jgi:type I restriction enzyme S subunit
VNSLSHLGKVGFVRALSEATVFESNIMRLAVDEARVLSGFAFAQLSSERAREHFLGRAKQAVAQASINQQDVKCFPVLLPGLAEQRAIVAALDAVSQRLRSEMESLDAISGTKTVLMSVLLTGEVRVRVDEESAA